MIVRLAENPLLLRGWTIIDNRGNTVTVALTDMQTGMQLADSLFKNDRALTPADSARRRN